MVAAVAAKTTWNIQKARTQGSPSGTEVAQEKAGSSEPSGAAGTEHDPEPDGPECQGTHGKIHEVFHHDVDGIFRTGKPCLNHGKTCLHEKHQGCRNQRPHIIRMGLHQIDGMPV